MYLDTDMNAFSLQLQMQKQCFDQPLNVEYSFEIINYNKKMKRYFICEIKTASRCHQVTVKRVIAIEPNYLNS